MRDLLLASIDRLLLQHSDGLMRVDNAALWRAIVDAGFTRMRLDDEDITLSDALAMVSLAAELGARLPLGDVLMADWLLLRAGVDDAPFCTLASGGELQINDAGTLSGVVHEVAGANQCAHLLSSAIDTRGAPHLVIAATEPGEPHTNIAGESRYSVRYRHAPVQTYATSFNATDIRAIAALARCAQMTGAMARVLDLVLEHAATRVQFGKPLAKLQAVQQLEAIIAGQIALSFAALDRAAGADGEGEGVANLAFFAAVAKSVVSEAAGKVAAAAHQIFGAMGVSQEHELQHHTRALWAWRDENGAEHFWRAIIGRRALQAGGAGLWPMMAQA